MNGDPETRQVLVNNDINWPNGLTIDYQTERLWWVDAKIARIESMNFDGSDRRTEVDGRNGELGHPFSLAVFGQSIFWTDWKHKFIYRTTKKDPSNRITVVKHVQNLLPMDIKIIHPHQQLKGKR
jgi:low density lipoprotein receptor-related protein 5/6